MAENEIRFLGDLSRLRLQPGDRFVLSCDHPLHTEVHARIQDTWRRFVDDEGGTVPLLILERGMRLGAISPRPPGHMAPDALPPPDTIIDYADGQFGPLMFHYAAEGQRFDDIAREAGFETHFLSMEDDLASDDHPLMVEHFTDGQNTALPKWTPTSPGDDWKLVAKYDTEEGPMACFVRLQLKAEG